MKITAQQHGEAEETKLQKLESSGALAAAEFDARFDREASRTAGGKPYRTEGTRQKPPVLGPQGKPTTKGEFQLDFSAVGNYTEAFFFSF